MVKFDEKKSLAICSDILNDFCISHTEDRLSTYIGCEKNSTIEKLFNGSNGRIVIKGDELKEIIGKNSSSQNYILSLINERLNQEYHRRDSNRFSDTFSRSALRFIDRVEFDEKWNVKKRAVKFHNEGMKITKALIKQLEITKEENFRKLMPDGHARMEKELKHFKQNLIGVEIPDIINNTGGKTELYEGKSLVLSILPEDFLTMSFGNSWTSCMDLDDDYYSATLPLAKGKDTVLAFLISNDDLENDPNGRNKIWRQVVAVKDENRIALSTHYPKENILMSNVVSRYILGDFKIAESYKYSLKTQLVTGYVDFYNQSENTVLVVKNNEETYENEWKIEVQSKDNVCLTCGKVTNLLDEEMQRNYFQCSDCW